MSSRTFLVMKSLDYEHIYNRESLANALGIPLSELTGVLYGKGADSYYQSFDIPKKDGSVRRIDASTSSLKYIQRRLVRLLELRQKEIWGERGLNPNISHAFQRGKSILSNARVHKNKRYVVNVDLEDFFGSIHFGRVKGFFEHNNDFKLPTDVATIIAQLTCYKGRLPQGAPSSPIITNLICNIMDIRLLRLAKEYRLDYTRYADDLTFSTNNKKFINCCDEFLSQLNVEIERAGFHINNKKTRLAYKSSRQVVTGVTVNEKLAVNSKYRKETRAMADHLYRTGKFNIGGESATINQLEGRFSFIDQIDRYNRKNGENVASKVLNSREFQYKQFLFFKYFFGSFKPIIMTEGETDSIHIKAALKNKYKEYTNLIEKTDGSFAYKVSFFNMSGKKTWLLDISDGGDKYRRICEYYGMGSKKPENLTKRLMNKSNTHPNYPVVLLFDNEDSNEKPLYKTLNSVKAFCSIKDVKDHLNKEGFYRLNENLYFATMPKTVIGDMEIEDLYGDAQLQSFTIHGKTYCKHFEKSDTYDSSKHYTKKELANYVAANWRNVSFEGYEGLLSALNTISEDYIQFLKENSYKTHNSL